MEPQGQKHILLNEHGINVKCYLEHIVCIISTRKGCKIYELVDSGKKLIIRECSHRLPWFTAQITDPHYFEIMQGTTVNARHVKGVGDDRVLQINIAGVPSLVVTKALKADFLDHLLRY